jgi:hypothetical protein
MLFWDADAICALVGLSAMVVGISSGALNKTYSNFPEAREAATENAVVPMLVDFADTLGLQLLPDYGDADVEQVQPDLTKVRSLQEDENAKWLRVVTACEKGIILVNEGRAMLGLPEMEGGDATLPEQNAERAQEAFERQGPPESAGDRAVTAEQPAARNGNGRLPSNGKALALPDEVRITKADVADAEDLWNESMEGFEGLLSAEPVNGNGARP